MEVVEIRRGPLKFTGVKRSSLLSRRRHLQAQEHAVSSTTKALPRQNAEIPPMFLQLLLRNVAAFVQIDATIVVFLLSLEGLQHEHVQLFLLARQQAPYLFNKLWNSTAVFCHGHITNDVLE